MEYPKPPPKLKKKPTPIKRFSEKQAQKEREKIATYKAIKKTRPSCCQGCRARQFENSHRISQEESRWIADAGNIDLFCRDCHLAYESGRVYQLDNGADVMQWLRENSHEHFMRKAYQMKDRIEGGRIEVENLPEWVGEIVKELS